MTRHPHQTEDLSLKAWPPVYTKEGGHHYSGGVSFPIEADDASESVNTEPQDEPGLLHYWAEGLVALAVWTAIWVFLAEALH